MCACAGMLSALMRKIYIASLAVLLLGAFLLVYPLHALVFSAGDRLVFFRAVVPGDTFLLGYLHSVEKSDVWDRFHVDPEYRIVLTETMFQGQGAGLPAGLDANEYLTRDGRWFRIAGMRRVVPSLNWSVEAGWHNRLRFGNEQEQDISSRVGDAVVHIRVEKINIFKWLAYYLTVSVF